MRLLAITPIHVDEAELARRQRRYDRLSPPGVTIDLRDLGDGDRVPRALESDEDVRTSESAMLEALGRLDPAGFDALLPDCVLDPLIDHVGPPLPVLGIGRLAAHFLTGFGGRLVAVARNAAIAGELDRRLAQYRVPADRTEVLDLNVEDIADDIAWDAAVRSRTAGARVDHVLNACSAVEVAPAGGEPQVVDPTRLALQLIALREGWAA